MNEKEKYSDQEAKRAAGDKKRHEADLAKEQEIIKAQKVKETKRNEELARENIKEAAKDKARREEYQAREKKIAEEQKANINKSGNK